ncbi:hypothetical protein OOZ63_12145 [Paucibacter sp. PLA-PC-4]|uniref:hypothetical protein n=1 Tax=Paucibacter sp. PLA-PC-4 TaxID=2993655 RepID=UPI002248B48C|nr:hypothetical protein [Paucibacter sp. PLA-PC-4]MCX2862591.1 hypothetical protein [Paucibacter sp. PLA-PC-4]
MEKIKIVLPDTGPLITLAHANALELLLAFDADQVQLVVTDMVEFEATRLRSTHEDAQRIASFIEKNAGRIVIEKTNFGQSAISAARQHERYAESQQIRDYFAANGWPPPPAVPPNTGELSINSYVAGLIGQPPGPPCLVIAEDDFFLRSTPGALPGNAHIISTAALLAKLEELNPKLKARDVLDAAKHYKGRDPNRTEVDQPAQKIKGGSDWGSTVNATNLTAKLTKKADPKSKDPSREP